MILQCLLLLFLLVALPASAGLIGFRADDSGYLSVVTCEMSNVFAPFLSSPLGEISAGDNTCPFRPNPGTRAGPRLHQPALWPALCRI